MALTKPKPSLREAIDVVLAHCGDNKDLHSQLETLKGEQAAPGASAPREQRDTPEDDYSFETARKRHQERTAAEPESPTEDKQEGGEER
jgi:hypothetical protein